MEKNEVKVRNSVWLGFCIGVGLTLWSAILGLIALFVWLLIVAAALHP